MGSKRKCESYKVFEKNINRAEAFTRAFTAERSPGRPHGDDVELLRGAVVFAVGALDNFMSELVLELVPQFGGDNSAMRGPLADIAKKDPSLALRVAIRHGSDAQDEFRRALSDWLETKSFHGPAKVENALGYIGVAIENESLPDNWKARLDAYTIRRHRIVHRGDDTTIKWQYAVDCTSLVADIGKAVNGAAVKRYNEA